MDDLKQADRLEDVLMEFAKAFPAVKESLIDERDIYLAQKIREAEGARVVAVVGAGHVPGIAREIEREQSLDVLEEVPEPSLWAGSVKWVVPVLILAIIAYGFYSAGAAHSLESISIWVLVNGVLAAAGAALGPGTSDYGAGGVPGGAHHQPQPHHRRGLGFRLGPGLGQEAHGGGPGGNVRGGDGVPKGLWRNPVSRILLVVVFSNLGSTLGTFIGGSWIAARSF